MGDADYYANHINSVKTTFLEQPLVDYDFVA